MPVDAARALFRLDVHLVQVDIHLGDVHLEAVGQQPDGLPHGAIAWPPRHGKQGLRRNHRWERGQEKERQREKGRQTG